MDKLYIQDLEFALLSTQQWVREWASGVCRMCTGYEEHISDCPVPSIDAVLEITKRRDSASEEKQVTDPALIPE